MAAENQAKVTNDGKKRKRRYLPHNKGVRKKGPYPLKPGVQGFFITCDGGRESQASHEAINVIDSFFEELIHGEGSHGNTAAIPGKPLNKKIKFTYSDSSDNEEEDDNDDETEEENQSERPADNGSTVKEISNSAKKNDQPHEVGSGQAADGDEEASKQVADGDEEASKQAADGDEEASKQAADGDEEASKQAADGDEEVSKQAANGDEEACKQTDDQSKKNEEPPEKKQCCDTKRLESRNHQSTEKSVDQLIEAELKELGDKSKRRFSKIDTGCNGVVFIQMRRKAGDPNPGDIVQHIMESASATKKHMSRFLLRVLPVELSCYASEEEISRAIKPLIEQHFPVDAEAPVKFAVQYDARANTGIERMKIIDAVAKSVPGPHTVDLKTPEKTIIVQVVKTVCLIGVVEKYKELLKYNLRQLTSSKP